MPRTDTRSRATSGTKKTTRLFEFEVSLLNGPITKAYSKRNKKGVSRTIQIRGDQTLDALHEIIFVAFDRYDEHLYEFQIGGKGPMDPKARRYFVPSEFDDAPPTGNSKRARIESIGLKVGEPFGYWFDFGDDWWHQVNVVAIHDEIPRGKFPKITEKVGESPPQYPEWDEEDGED
jgi:hypothetical protein